LIVTTIATGRRERVKWAREALAEAFYAFVDTSYTAATAARKRQEALWDGSADDERSTAAELDRQHSILRNNLTRIRLLAPSRTLQKAQSVRQATRISSTPWRPISTRSATTSSSCTWRGNERS